MRHETPKTDIQPDIQQENVTYEGGSLAYLHINAEQADPTKNKVVVIPGFTQGVEVLGDFGKALAEDDQREVFVLDQPERTKKTFDKKLKGEIGLNQQVEAFLEFIEQNELTDEPLDAVGQSLGAAILAETAIRAHARGWTCFSSEDSHTFFTGAAGINSKEKVRTLGTRWARWMLRNMQNDKVLDTTGEMLKAGVENATQDPRKTANEMRALTKYRINFEKLSDAGVEPTLIGYADDHLMPYIDRELVGSSEYTAGAVSVIDNLDNAPTLPNGEPNLANARSLRKFKKQTGLKGKEARSAWVHNHHAAEHNDIQFHPRRTTRFILDVLSRKEQQK